MQKTGLIRASIAALALVVLFACTPTVKVSTDEPITINLNVNIKHEILVKIDKDLDDLFDEDSELF
ncbi:MAG: YnbE family lipoprotein [Gammaproteobacteria bacterium]|nr:YnbE family lipoprotein [Pseudomonadota bacterium]TDJ30702.1 MAG: YnbE family lipoprotein [Gammaproteobacteria bacterium]TDJ36741.1 MAG: YnbE family lipoprotein [Gammaproteobacteria bacterium]